MAIKIPTKVFEELERIRQSGETNMLDYNMVMVLANKHEEYETVVWLADNKKVYAEGIFEGFEPE